MTLAIERSPGSAHRDAKKAPCGRGRAANQPHETGGCLPLLASITGVATAPQASSNTYPNGLTPRQQTAALWRLSTTHYEKEMRHAQETKQAAPQPQGGKGRHA